MIFIYIHIYLYVDLFNSILLYFNMLFYSWCDVFGFYRLIKCRCRCRCRHLRVCVCTGGCPFVSGPRHRTLVTPLRVLQNLHAAHQGTSMIEQRARAIVYWPGISMDIHDTRDRCADCNRNAPTQAATPVFADFFTYGGRHYLVVGDRLSGWGEVFGSPAGTTLAGAAGLIRHLRSFLATFGVPEELSSDGGPEFAAGCTEVFLRFWGV